MWRPTAHLPRLETPTRRAASALSLAGPGSLGTREHLKRLEVQLVTARKDADRATARLKRVQKALAIAEAKLEQNSKPDGVEAIEQRTQASKIYRLERELTTLQRKYTHLTDTSRQQIRLYESAVGDAQTDLANSKDQIQELKKQTVVQRKANNRTQFMLKRQVYKLLDVKNAEDTESEISVQNRLALTLAENEQLSMELRESNGSVVKAEKLRKQLEQITLDLRSKEADLSRVGRIDEMLDNARHKLAKEQTESAMLSMTVISLRTEMQSLRRQLEKMSLRTFQQPVDLIATKKEDATDSAVPAKLKFEQESTEAVSGTHGSGKRRPRAMTLPNRSSPVVDDPFKVAFSMFDEDLNGSIDAPELRKVMKLLGYNVTMAEAKAMVAEADQDGDNAVSLDEFLLIVSKSVKSDLWENAKSAASSKDAQKFVAQRREHEKNGTAHRMFTVATAGKFMQSFRKET